MRVLVCGGRDYDDWEELCEELSYLFADVEIECIIHGGARGADKLAGEFAATTGIQEIVFPADWKAHGRAAGPIRNQKMLEEGKPDLVMAFAGGRGTADMMQRARAAGIEVRDLGPKISLAKPYEGSAMCGDADKWESNRKREREK